MALFSISSTLSIDLQSKVDKQKCTCATLGSILSSFPDLILFYDAAILVCDIPVCIVQLLNILRKPSPSKKLTLPIIINNFWVNHHPKEMLY